MTETTGATDRPLRRGLDRNKVLQVLRRIREEHIEDEDELFNLIDCIPLSSSIKTKTTEEDKYPITKLCDLVKTATITEEVVDQVDGEESETEVIDQEIVRSRCQIIKSIAEECTLEEELFNLLASKNQPICYDGFEPSGRMHIAQGVMKTLNVNKLTDAGCKMKIWIADWFAQLNNKLGGDLEKIQTVGHYMIEIWKAIGMKLDDEKVEFLWSSTEINARSPEYWQLVMNIACNTSLARILRCIEIMGRKDKDSLLVSHILYACMQCADIFFLQVDICQMGLDQRKVNMLAREHCNETARPKKPIILSHHMLAGLKQGQEKMSKSDPLSAIYMDDDEAEVINKISKAYCLPTIVEGNPCLEYIKFIIFPWFHDFTVKRHAENGGDKTYVSFEELVADYETGSLHPADLKPALSSALNMILQPVRDHFKKDAKAKDLLERVMGYQITR